MRILVDECVDQRLRHFLPTHDCQTAQYAKLAGFKNGALLLAAETAGFEVILTTDQEILHQQNLRVRRIAILVLCGPTNRLADLKELIPATLRALESIRPGQLIEVR